MGLMGLMGFSGNAVESGPDLVDRLPDHMLIIRDYPAKHKPGTSLLVALNYPSQTCNSAIRRTLGEQSPPALP